jgi:hypothetical protein
VTIRDNEGRTETAWRVWCRNSAVGMFRQAKLIPVAITANHTEQCIIHQRAKIHPHLGTMAENTERVAMSFLGPVVSSSRRRNQQLQEDGLSFSSAGCRHHGKSATSVHQVPIFEILKRGMMVVTRLAGRKESRKARQARKTSCSRAPAR